MFWKYTRTWCDSLVVCESPCGRTAYGSGRWNWCGWFGSVVDVVVVAFVVGGWFVGALLGSAKVLVG